MKFLKTLLVSIVLLGAVSAAQAEDLEFTFNNHTDYAVTAIHISLTSSSSWEENILSGAIDPYESSTISIEDGADSCMYDMRFTFSDGDTVEERDADLCEMGSYTIE